MSELADHCLYVLALEHPTCGCNRPEAPLSPEGRRVSSIAIQKIVHDHGLRTRYDRGLVLEKASTDKAPELAAEQMAFLETLNPCFREDHVESTASDGLPSADSFFVGTLEGSGQGLSPTRPAGEPILTDYRRELCGTERHGYELYLDHSGIKHRRTRVRSPKTLRRAFQRHHPRRILPYQDAGAPL